MKKNTWMIVGAVLVALVFTTAANAQRRAAKTRPVEQAFAGETISLDKGDPDAITIEPNSLEKSGCINKVQMSKDDVEAILDKMDKYNLEVIDFATGPQVGPIQDDGDAFSCECWELVCTYSGGKEPVCVPKCIPCD